MNTARKSPPTLAQEAVRIARKGTKIFPCVNRLGHESHKKPMVKGGFTKASNDPHQVMTWWSKWPDALIGMPTGSAMGCTVVDVDCGKENEEGEAADLWWQEHKHEFTGATIVQTQSGGLHVYCRYNGERNTQGGIAKGVDRRGEGGYVIIPPSPGYTILDEHPMSEWPSVPESAGNSHKILELLKYRDGRHEDSIGQMADVLINLMINPDEWHRNAQRMAFMLANWWHWRSEHIEEFCLAALEAAHKGGTITRQQYDKHRVRIPRLAAWYHHKVAEEMHEEILAAAERWRVKATVDTIVNATDAELDELEDLIREQREARNA